MDNNSLQKIKDIISRADHIAIGVGKNPTIDEMGAALAFTLALEGINKRVTVVCPTDPIVEISNLVGIDKVRNSLVGDGGDLVVSFPYKEGEIEKVSYTIDNDFLNIVVTAGEKGLSFNERDVKYTRGGGAPSVFIIVGTPRLSDLEGLFNPEALKDTTIINIDNKADNQGFGDLVLVSPKFSSVSEQVADLVLALGYDIDVDASQNLLSGISYATGNFQDPKTSYLAFEIASILMKKGALRNSNSPALPKQDANSFMQQLQQDDRSTLPKPRVSEERPFPTPQSQEDIIRQELRRQQDRTTDRPQPQTQPRPQQQVKNPQRPDFGGNRQQPQRPQPQHVQPQQNQTQNTQQDEPFDDTPPEDWLTPKVYKGSSNV